MFIFGHKMIKKSIYIFVFFILVGMFNTSIAGNTDSPYDKILNVSESFIDTPYILNPLGEGDTGTISKNPLYRFDAFDCQTFVETVLAKSLTNTDADFKNMMNKIRYRDGIISFETRNHFQNPDWVENNKWIVENISDVFVKSLDEIGMSKITLNRQQWFKQNYMLDVDVPIQNVSLNYVPLEYLSFNIDWITKKIDHPYIFMTIVNGKTTLNKIGTEYDVSHTGFLIKKDGELYIRHASLTYKKVVDEKFSDYIKKLQKNPKYLGFSILEIKA